MRIASEPEEFSEVRKSNRMPVFFMRLLSKTGITTKFEGEGNFPDLVSAIDEFYYKLASSNVSITKDDVLSVSISGYWCLVKRQHIICDHLCIIDKEPVDMGRIENCKYALKIIGHRPSEDVKFKVGDVVSFTECLYRREGTITRIVESDTNNIIYVVRTETRGDKYKVAKELSLVV